MGDILSLMEKDHGTSIQLLYYFIQLLGIMISLRTKKSCSPYGTYYATGSLTFQEFTYLVVAELSARFHTKLLLLDQTSLLFWKWKQILLPAKSLWSLGNMSSYFKSSCSCKLSGEFYINFYTLSLVILCTIFQILNWSIHSTFYFHFQWKYISCKKSSKR